MAALKRYKWLIIAMVAVGSVAGVLALRFVHPKYEVSARVMIAEPPDPRGPIRSGQVLNEAAWRELLTSFAILDPVARRLRLYVIPETDADAALFKDFDHTSDLRPGKYTLTVDPATKKYELSLKANGETSVVERGTPGDSIGRTVGFLWNPPAAEISSRKELAFEVRTPRDAASEIESNMIVILPMDSRFLRISLKGERPQQLAATMNNILAEFVAEAEVLKKKNLTDVRLALEEQREQAKAAYENASGALENLKIRIATLPTQGSISMAGGVASTTPLAMNEFAQMRVDYDRTRRDREALEALLSGPAGRRLTPEALLSIPGIVTGSPNLNSALQTVTEKEATARTLRERYTDKHPLVADVDAQLTTLETQTIPGIARQSLEQLKARERELDRRIQNATPEIKAIPQRTLQEGSLTRDRDLAYTLYADIEGRYAQAKMAEAAATPDVGVLDSAQVPLKPSTNTAPTLLAMIIGGSLALGVLLALLLDAMDKRFRYPDQATHELGLDILATIPSIHRSRKGVTRIEDQSQLVEAFRGLRLSIRNSLPEDGPVSIAITSPGPGDGKSLISSNLALAFAEAGYRTLLIDGDIRRGQLHSTFDVPQRPGFVDHLSGDIALEDVIRETAHENLFIIPCGSRRHRGPELLAADGTARLIRSLRSRFDAIIVDTAPLGAGIDPFALGAATGNLALVLRTGRTDRKLAHNKLEILDRMPVRVVGAILNDVRADAFYKYYSYLDGYGTLDEDEPPRIGATGSGRAVATTRAS
jgi:polysaccharide biosynthesis transport protein